MSNPITIQATILDLSGNHILPHQPARILRRTASGHLFQPCNQIVKGSEIVNVMSKPGEWVGQEPIRWKQGVGVVRRIGRRVERAVLRECCCGERDDHRCWVKRLVRGVPNSETLPWGRNEVGAGVRK